MANIISWGGDGEKASVRPPNLRGLDLLKLEALGAFDYLQFAVMFQGILA